MPTQTATSENRFNIQFMNNKELSKTVLTGQIPSFTHNHTLVMYAGEYVKMPGDNLEIGELTINFKLQENYENYIILYDWMQNNFLNANNSDLMEFDTIEYLILNAAYTPILSFTYGYCYPTVIEQIDHTTQTAGADELEFSVTFVVNTVVKNSF